MIHRVHVEQIGQEIAPCANAAWHSSSEMVAYDIMACSSVQLTGALKLYIGFGGDPAQTGCEVQSNITLNPKS